jgi:K+-sensing histidine kinase KdpD
MLERVIQNLVENALKCTPEYGSILANVSVKGGHVIFRIENSGDPLPDDILQWIHQFKDDSAKHYRRPLKLGLGLFIVQKILLLHNSSLLVKHEKGVNIFSFSLPVYNKV